MTILEMTDMVLVIILRDVPQENIFKLGTSAAANDFSEWVQAGTDAYIPRQEYRFKNMYQGEGRGAEGFCGGHEILSIY